MEILKDYALVLNRKYYNDSNILVTLFTKKHGKIMVLAYGIRKSKKKEIYSLGPTNYIEVEINKKLNDMSLAEHRLIKVFKTFHQNIHKLELSLYIVYVLDKILAYNQEEKELYEIILKIYEYLDSVDSDSITNEYIFKFVARFLKRIIIELGIYSDELDKKNLNTQREVEKYERYICTYFNIQMDYNKIIRSDF